MRGICGLVWLLRFLKVIMVRLGSVLWNLFLLILVLRRVCGILSLFSSWLILVNS